MKPRSDAKLLNLPEEKQAQLVEWLLSGMPYHQVKELLAREWGVDTSLAALSSYYAQACAPALLARRSQAVSTADDLATAAASTPGRFDQATIDSLKQRAFELSISPHANPKDVKALFMLVLKSRDQDLKNAQVELALAKFQRDTAELFLKWAEDQRARQILASPDSNTSKIERLGQLMFGENWK